MPTLGKDHQTLARVARHPGCPPQAAAPNAKKAEKAEKGTFQVVIDVDLPPAARQNIARAIQKAVLNELAKIDVAGGYSVSLRKEDIAKTIEGGGQTDGIHIREQ